MISTLVSNDSNSQSGGRYFNSFLKETVLKEKTLGLCSISLAAEELALSIVAFCTFSFFQGQYQTSSWELLITVASGPQRI
ncbi:MAG: hypothetical protein K1X48_07730 [Burkholderiaceae bacterium]|nr:hypothetical protein [Burkholderiaceae bacterium]